MIVVVKASPPLAYFLVAFAFAAAIAILVYKGRYLPRFIMDILDRLTNKAQLERAYEAKSTPSSPPSMPRSWPPSSRQK